MFGVDAGVIFVVYYNYLILIITYYSRLFLAQSCAILPSAVCPDLLAPYGHDAVCLHLVVPDPADLAEKQNDLPKFRKTFPNCCCVSLIFFCCCH